MLTIFPGLNITKNVPHWPAQAAPVASGPSAFWAAGATAEDGGLGLFFFLRFLFLRPMVNQKTPEITIWNNINTPATPTNRQDPG